MISLRPVVLAALAGALARPTLPAAAQDDLSRQLIDQCVGCRLPKDLRGRDLHGVRFIGSDLRNVDFSRANLRGARFSGADLSGAKFDDADLRDARFDGVDLRGVSFKNAKLEGVKLTGVDFTGHGSVGMHRHAPSVRRWVYREDDDWAMPPIPPMPPMPDIGPEIERAMRAAHERLRARMQHLREHPLPAPPVPPQPPVSPLPARPDAGDA